MKPTCIQKVKVKDCLATSYSIYGKSPGDSMEKMKNKICNVKEPYQDNKGIVVWDIESKYSYIFAKCDLVFIDNNTPELITNPVKFDPKVLDI